MLTLEDMCEAKVDVHFVSLILLFGILCQKIVHADLKEKDWSPESGIVTCRTVSAPYPKFSTEIPDATSETFNRRYGQNGWRAIKYFEQLREADHIFWQRPLGFDHHGIVTAINTDSQIITILEFAGDSQTAFSGSTSSFWGTSKAEIKINNKPWDDIKANLHLRLHSKELPPKETLEQATLLLNLVKDNKVPYHLMLQNCEHLATFLKTGKAESMQVIEFGKKILELSCPNYYSIRKLRKLLQATAEDADAEG